MKRLSVLAGIAAICAAFTFAPQAMADSHHGGHGGGSWHGGGHGGSWHGGGHYYRGGGGYYRSGWRGGVFFGGPWNYGYGYPYYGSGYYEPSPGYYYNDNAYVVAPVRAGSLSRDVQVALRNDGYYGGRIDGIVGAGTRRAISRFQVDHNLPVTGTITGSLLSALGLD